jgi:hypothetical protein
MKSQVLAAQSHQAENKSPTRCLLLNRQGAGMRLLVAMNLVDDLDAIAIKRLTELGYRGGGRDRRFDRFAMLYPFVERTIPLIR